MAAQLPPGPRGRLRSTYRVLSDPAGNTARWLARYGDPVALPTMNGTVVLTANPEHVRAVFAGDPKDYEPFAPRALEPVAGAASLFSVSGERHRRERKLLAPPFHGARMKTYADSMAASADQRLRALAAEGGGSILAVAQAISLEVIIRSVFGVTEPEHAREHAEAVRALVDAAWPAMLFLPVLQRRFGGLGPFARFVARRTRLDALLQARLERARAHPGEDVLSLMLASRYDDGTPMSEADVHDELRTLLIAGHETTAIAIAWAVDALGRDAELLARVRDEVSSAGDVRAIGAMPLLDAVCSEALRRYPVVTEVMRVLRTPRSFAGFEIPAGWALGASIVGVHMRDDLYPEPHRFRPERFLERSFGPFEFLPFGGGHRRCIGAAFAIAEIKIVLATLVSGYELSLRSAAPPRAKRHSLTLGPSDGVPVSLRAAG